KPALPSRSRVAQLAIPGDYRLLLATDPWTEMRLPAPDDEERRIAADWLATRGFLPTSVSLAGLVLEAKSLTELKDGLRSSGIDTLLVEVAAPQLVSGKGIRPTAGDERFGACTYWSEFADWLAHLPRRAFALSPDRRIAAAVLDLGDA